MKNYFLLLLLLIATQTFAQKKGKMDPKDVTIDSLKAVSDSLSKSLDKYYGVYTAVKEKVFKYEFNPANTAKLIDSLRAQRDTTFSHTLKDTVNMLTKASVKLKTQVDSLTEAVGKLSLYIEQSKGLTIPADVSVEKIIKEKPKSAAEAGAEADKAKVIADLKQLKELLDAGIITQQEFDAKRAKLIEKL